MNWLLKGLSTTVGKKFVMGLTGLLLCGFLTVHLGGNLLLYAGEEAFNEYAHALHSHEVFVLIAELILLVIFALHIVLGIVLTQGNQAARPIPYTIYRSKKNPSILIKPPETWMFVSGLLVLLFLLLHLSEFRFSIWMHQATAGKEPFEKAQILLRDPLTAIVYIVGSIILGLHLSHGFASAFQSLGLNHPKYTPAIEVLGIVFAIVVAVGFASLPIWAWATMEPL